MKSNLYLNNKFPTLETGKILYHSSSKKPVTSMITTFMPPRWIKMKKVNSVGPFKNIENNLDGFTNEMDKIWKTGAMKIGLLKNNPTLD